MDEKTEVDESTALATLFAYKRKVIDDKDYLAMSDAVISLKKTYSSMSKVKKLTGYSTETLRALGSLRDLPDEVQTLIKEKKLGYEAHKILSIHSSTDQEEEKRRVELAQALIGVNDTDDFRAIIEYVKKNSNTPVEKCKQLVLESKTIKKKVFMVVAELSEEQYMPLKGLAARQNISVDDLIGRIVNEWLEMKNADR